MNVSLNRLTPYFFVLPALALLAVFVYGPAIENVGYSLYSWSSMSAAKRFVGLANYNDLFTNPIFWRSLFNNVVYAVVSVFFQVVVALVLAAILQAGVFGPPMKSVFRTTLFLPSILPVTVVGLLWQLIYQPSIGLVDQLLTATGLDSLSHVWLGEEQTALISIVMVSQWQWTG